VSLGVASRLLQRARRHLLRQRWASPVLTEWGRWRTLHALRRRPAAPRRVLAPPELVADVPEGVPYARTFAAGADLAVDAAVLRLDRLQDLDVRTLGAVRARMACTFASRRRHLTRPKRGA